SLLERLRSVRIELQDIGHEASGAALEVDLDPAAVDRLNERLDSLNRLLQKHRCEDETALIALREDLRER
ncbi:MAG: DNA repair protein RecN, partial [Flavobacteriales bacterium]|nr:DNA repair protein RecN [Flavobacteriales bacterium]